MSTCGGGRNLKAKFSEVHSGSEILARETASPTASARGLRELVEDSKDISTSR